MNNIVLVDDDDVINDIHKHLIETNFNAINVISLRSGKQLIDFIFSEGEFQNQKFKQPLHILVDLNMPEMNGIDTLILIKNRNEKLYRQLKISVLSAQVNINMQKISSQLAIINYIPKPLQIETLNRIIEINSK